VLSGVRVKCSLQHCGVGCLVALHLLACRAHRRVLSNAFSASRRDVASRLEMSTLQGTDDLAASCQKSRQRMDHHSKALEPALKRLQQLDSEMSRLFDQAERSARDMESHPHGSLSHSNATDAWRNSMKKILSLVQEQGQWIAEQRASVKATVAELTACLERLDASLDEVAEFREHVERLNSVEAPSKEKKKDDKEKKKKKNSPTRSSPRRGEERGW